MLKKIAKMDLLFVIFLILATVSMLLIPSSSEVKKNYSYYKARIIETDNSLVGQYGLIRQGEQDVTLEILNGPHKGKRFETSNTLIGKMELDKFLKKGDIVLAEVFETQGAVFVNVTDYYRSGAQFILFAAFSFILIFYSGWTGFKALISFVSSLVGIWKVLIPLLLKGYDPVLSAFVFICVLTAVIIYLVGGFTKKGNVAFLGSISGILFSLLITELFSKPFHINGAIKPFSEALIHSGYANLDLNKLFISGIFIACSGAIMDIAMDISASMNEVILKKPSISRKELLHSGLNVGRSVTGTMTTTLLLAYSGGYSTLLMAFMAQGVSTFAMLNINYISSEILNTLVGSFGLILTAPLTALIGAFVYKPLKTSVYSESVEKEF